jgi:hypothetical protein
MLYNSPALFLDNSGDFNENSPLIAYDNSTGSIAATTSNALYPASNLMNPATHLLWKGTVSTGTEYLTATLAGVKNVECVGIARHNFHSIGATVSLEGATALDGFGAPVYSTLVPAKVPTDASPILFRFNPALYISLRVRLDVAGSTPPQAAVFYACPLLVLQRRIYVGHTPLNFGRSTKVSNGRSESGNYLGRVVTGEGRSTSFSIQNMTPNWARVFFDPFIAAAAEAPFFFAWRPGSYPSEIGYAWLTNDARLVNQRTNGMMQIDVELSGIV